MDRNRFKGSGGNSQCHITTLSTGGIHLRTQHALPVLLAARGWASASSLCQRQWERSDATASFGAPTTPPHSPSYIIRCGCNVKRSSPNFPVGKRGVMAVRKRNAASRQFGSGDGVPARGQQQPAFSLDAGSRGWTTRSCQLPFCFCRNPSWNSFRSACDNTGRSRCARSRWSVRRGQNRCCRPKGPTGQVHVRPRGNLDHDASLIRGH